MGKGRREDGARMESERRARERGRRQGGVHLFLDLFSQRLVEARVGRRLAACALRRAPGSLLPRQLPSQLLHLLLRESDGWERWMGAMDENSVSVAGRAARRRLGALNA